MEISVIVPVFNEEDNLLALFERINKTLEKINKSISRGIFTRNSVYNQDFNDNCVLIEVGGPESSYESVSNSLKILAQAINNYIGDING